MHLVMFLVIGLLVGTLARFVVPGREPGGWVISMLIGIAGATVGGYFARLIGVYREGQPTGLVVAFLGAVALVIAYQALTSARARRA